MQLHVAFDDTDSLKGQCTTYLGTLFLKHLLHEKIHLTDFPQLIRLNPNVPFKTRGNGAVVFRLEVADKKQAEEVKKYVINLIDKNAHKKDSNTNPGAVFIEGTIHPYLHGFYKKALTEVIEVAEAEKLAKQVKAEYRKWKNGRGIIGALAAIGSDLHDDYTYELLAYRQKKNFKKPRKYNFASLQQMDEVLQHLTFANLYEDRPRIFPTGPDPVFCGIRGEGYKAVIQGFEMLTGVEKCDFYSLWRTNQGTDCHYAERKVKDLKPHYSGKIYGVVASNPEYFGNNPGNRHVQFDLHDDTGTIRCVAYEPTKEFRQEVAGLVKGDKVLVFGGVRPEGEFEGAKYPQSISLEKLQPLELIEACKLENPSCSKCGGKTSSLGKDKGFKCKKCGLESREWKKTVTFLPRTLEEGKSYIVPVCAIRHLTKPASREGRRQSPFLRPKDLDELMFKKLE